MFCRSLKTIEVPPSSIVYASAALSHASRSECENMWFKPSPDLLSNGLQIPEGPVLQNNQQTIPLYNPTDSTIILEQGAYLGQVAEADASSQEHLELLESEELGKLGAELFGTNECELGNAGARTDPGAGGAAEAVETSEAQRAEPSAGIRTRVPPGATSVAVPRHNPGFLLRWATLVVSLLLSGTTGLKLPDVMHCVDQPPFNRSSKSQNLSEFEPSCEDWKYNDLTGSVYSDAVLVEFDKQKDTSYQHLSQEQWLKLRDFVGEHADCLFIEGAKPTTIKDLTFDITLKEGAKPYKAPLRKLSPEQARKEQHHLKKGLRLGHLGKPDFNDLGPWSAPVYVVYKKEDELGRLICDFRLLNQATETILPISIADTRDKVRRLAGMGWKAMVDAVHGFNQIQCSKEARRKLQVQTTMGILQYHVLPFGVTNGPAIFQSAMQKIFDQEVSGGLEDLESDLDWHLDDGGLGTGHLNCSGQTHEQVLDRTFDMHLEALKRMFSRAREYDLKFKLSKCLFAQHEVTCLGMLAGLGVVKSDPQKRSAILEWPRPSRLEDVERLLATVSFIRQHLPATFSHEIKPLREILSQLHEKRAQGYKSQRTMKGSVNKPYDPDSPWPPFWSTEAETAFQRIKEMVADCVDLSVPDFEGAATGMNPFYIKLDACSYGIGAGLFQAKPDDTMRNTHYAALELPLWATKAEVSRAYAKNKKKFFGQNEIMKRIELAYETLMDDGKRKQYNASLNEGVTKFSDRTLLRPLGFMSKSLSGAQVNWTTWERELLAAVESVTGVFRSVVSGFPVIMITDHLNSTILTTELKSPDKVLRMLLKIESVVRPEWRYTPGRSNPVADGFSRNPADRDQTRDLFENKSHAPKTLYGCFQRARESTDSVDDGDWIVEARLIPEEEHSCVLRSMRQGLELFTRGPPNSVTNYASGTRSSTVPCLFIPNFFDEYKAHVGENFAISCKDFILKAEVILEPTVSKPLGTRRWFEDYENPPLGRKAKRRCRLTVMDGVLAGLRLLRSSALVAVVSHAEGAVLHAAMLCRELRFAAYRERQVSDTEKEALEETVEGIEHSVLLAPMTLPRSQLANLRECVPELTVVVPHPCQVCIVLPVKDSAFETSRGFAKLVAGAEQVSVPFPGPAYRSLPKGLVLERITYKPLKPVQKINYLPQAFIELMAGSAVLTAEMSRAGFTCRAFERLIDGKYQEGGDLSRPENRKTVAMFVVQKLVQQLHLAPDCSSFSSLSNLNPNSTRTTDCPQGNGSNQSEIEGNKGVIIAMWIILLCMTSGVFFSFEHPLRSKVWSLPFFKWLLALALVSGLVFVVEVDSCAYGARPANYHPEQGDLRIQKSFRIVTNNPKLVALHLKCGDVAPHRHDQILGATANNKAKSKETASYCRGLCARYAQLVKESFVESLLPKTLPSTFKVPNFETIDIVWKPDFTPEEAVGQRPVSVDKSPAPPEMTVSLEPAASIDKVNDYWIETDATFTRYHVRLRIPMFHPGNVAEACDVTDRKSFPPLEALTPQRTTIADYKGRTVTRSDEWQSATAHRFLGGEWAGRTIFYKKEPRKPKMAGDEEVLVPKIVPPLVSGFSSLRPELAVAQRKDSELNEIIQYLEKKPLSEVTTSKTLKSQIIKKSVLFSLTADGVLLAKLEGPGEYPVVPNIKYEGDVKDKPRGVTWKHLLLAACHNTSLTPHLRATEMVAILDELVYWNPPEHLRRDCETWTSRCKHCVSMYHRPADSAVTKPVVEYRPFYRLQIDLLEVKPKGEAGESHVLTAICVATRYLFLRVCVGREHTHIAEMLLDIVLDMGVVPVIIQSDQEFFSGILEEFAQLLGSRQIFATALRPQSQGVVERSHREIRNVLSILVESLSRVMPRKWPRYVRFAEARARHKTLTHLPQFKSRVTPYALIHGFYGSSSLKTALQVIKEIPTSIIHDGWISAVVQENQMLMSATADEYEREAERKQRSEVSQKTVNIKPGDLVLLSKPFFEKGTGQILPQAAGPYAVYRMLSAHTCQLCDVLTDELLNNGKVYATSRLIKFNYPVSHAREELEEDDLIVEFKTGDYVCVELLQGRALRVSVGKVIRVFNVGQQLEIINHEVARGERYRPWARRRWTPISPDPIQIAFNEVLCVAELQEMALTTRTLERLSILGVPIGGTAGKEKTLYGRVN